MAGFIKAITSIPSLVAIIKVVANWLNGVIAEHEINKKKADFSNAVDDSDVSKDTSEIDNIFNPHDTKPERVPDKPTAI